MPEQEGSPTEATEGAEATAGAAGTEGGKGGDDGKTFTQADVDRIAGNARIAERNKYADYDDLKTKAAELDKLREGEKTELQKAIERAEAAEKKARSELRGRIAATKGVPVGSLVGDTEEELIAKAEELLAWKGEGAPKQPEPKPKGPKHPVGAGDLKSGASGSDGTKTDPKEAAAEALRRLRAGN